MSRFTVNLIKKVEASIAILLLIVFTIALGDKSKCETCKSIATNFLKGLKNTAKSNFGGGNTDWEEKSLGAYAHSETRLIEILEGICHDEGKECHMMLEHQEETIENWWFKQFAKHKNVNLEEYLCIKKLQVCCAQGHFGENCNECQGGKDRPCKGNGKCLGDGTREGNGNCKCDDGYKGIVCDECTNGYFEESKNDTHISCKICDSACESSCWGEGPEGCDDCKEGWNYVEDKGCEDINECEVKEEPPCENDKYCMNTEGSFSCPKCDDACDECTGPGPDKCDECNPRYYKENETCKACHVSCEMSCTDSSPTSCDACRSGWEHTPEGCIDKNECESGEGNCAEDQYCINTEGSSKCSTCHSACNGCTGPGNQLCTECKEGYKKDDQGECKDIDECSEESSCPGENENCVNLPSSYRCECQEGFIKKEDKCEAKPKAKDSSKKKKRKKKQKKKKNTPEIESSLSEEDQKREPLDEVKDDNGNEKVVLSGNILEPVLPSAPVQVEGEGDSNGKQSVSATNSDQTSDTTSQQEILQPEIPKQENTGQDIPQPETLQQEKSEQEIPKQEIPQPDMPPQDIPGHEKHVEL